MLIYKCQNTKTKKERGKKMKSNKKQILICTIVGVILAWVSCGIVIAIIPLAIGFMALVGEHLYQQERRKEEKEWKIRNARKEGEKWGMGKFF